MQQDAVQSVLLPQTLKPQDGVEEIPAVLLNFKHANPDKETDILDIDLADADDIQACAQYVKEIYSYLLHAETKFQISPDFLAAQSELTPDDRTLMIDWSSRNHTRFNLANESFFHFVCILDAYLSMVPVSRADSRLIATSALLIAAKFEQSYIPSLRHFVESVTTCEPEFVPACHCQNARVSTQSCYNCVRERIIETEENILHALDFQLSMPTTLTFLRRYAKICDMKNRDRYIAFYIGELCTLNIAMAQFKQSEIAAGCIAMARRLTRKPSWDEQLEKYSGYTEGAIKKVMSEISNCLKKYAVSPKAKYIRRKYSLEDRFYGVSVMIENVVNQALGAGKPK